MTRDQFTATLKQAIEYGRSTVTVQLAHDQLVDHDAEQRARIERLEEKVKSYEGGCPHDSLGDQACTLEQQAQEIARLREALRTLQSWRYASQAHWSKPNKLSR